MSGKDKGKALRVKNTADMQLFKGKGNFDSELVSRTERRVR